MKQFILRTLKLAAVIVPVMLFLMLIPYNNRIETSRIRNFYKEPEDTLDVVLLGASEVFAGFCPGLAYEEYGFTSYDYAISQNYPELLKPQLEEVLRTQSPQVVVVDLNTLLYVGRNSSHDAVFRTYIEGTPLSLHKIKTIREHPYREQPLSYYVPFLMYHGSLTPYDLLVLWTNEKAYWENGGALLKGMSSCVDDETLGQIIDISQDHSRMDLPEEYEKTLRAFLEYCQGLEDTKILFVSFPHRITTDMAYNRFLQSNAAQDIVRSYGFDYINMEYLTQEIGLNLQKDFYNDEHLNVHGQRKFTRNLARILVEDYGVTPRPQTTENGLRWEQTVKYSKLLYAYHDKLSQHDPKSDLMLCEEGWLLSELDWMEKKLQEDGLPLTFDPVYQ